MPKLAEVPQPEVRARIAPTRAPTAPAPLPAPVSAPRAAPASAPLPLPAPAPTLAPVSLPVFRPAPTPPSLIAFPINPNTNGLGLEDYLVTSIHHVFSDQRRLVEEQNAFAIKEAQWRQEREDLKRKSAQNNEELADKAIAINELQDDVRYLQNRINKFRKTIVTIIGDNSDSPRKRQRT